MSHPEPLAPAPGRTAARHRLRAWLPDLVAFAGALMIAGLAALLLGSLPGCGGGVGSEGTGSFASGTITGYGSIIVNGVHFDEAAAQRQDDDGTPLASEELALGMVVDVSAGPISTAADGTQRAVALSVRANRALVGPVAAPDAAAGRLTVLGQTVLVSADTVFDAQLAGWYGLTAGRVIVVYGQYDSARAAYAATRLAPATGAAGTAWRVSGPVATVDSGSRSFTLGSQTYSYATLAGSSGPSAGEQVRLNLSSAQPDGDGRWPLSAQRSDTSTPQDRDGAALDGRIATLLSATGFVVNGVTVDASLASISGSLQLGAQVTVSGALRAGVLVASRVQVLNDGAKSFELNGSITSLDSADRSFVLRGTTVGYARTDLRFDNNGSAAQLAVGRKVKVEGLLSADRTRLEATRIRFDD